MFFYSSIVVSCTGYVSCCIVLLIDDISLMFLCSHCSACVVSFTDKHHGQVLLSFVVLFLVGEWRGGVVVLILSMELVGHPGAGTSSPPENGTSLPPELEPLCLLEGVTCHTCILELEPLCLLELDPFFLLSCFLLSRTLVSTYIVLLWSRNERLL
ncbi:hypothetical protein Bca4012_010604 [Brassica carinata]|uniref:Uncharacterized protein n=1 Tax=Brassica carinata TaxID=52824 RepID=A0A8X7V0M8_BRACI|nr:hypothetical protein Bca52824_035512 [Brassica carinata]